MFRMSGCQEGAVFFFLSLEKPEQRVHALRCSPASSLFVFWGGCRTCSLRTFTLGICRKRSGFPPTRPPFAVVSLLENVWKRQGSFSTPAENRRQSFFRPFKDCTSVSGTYYLKLQSYTRYAFRYIQCSVGSNELRWDFGGFDA